MKKGKKAAKPGRAAGKRKARSRKVTRPAQTRSAWQQRQDADDIRRAVEDGMQDLRMKK